MGASLMHFMEKNKENNMRKKKKNLPMILAIVVGILALALVTFGRYMISANKNKAVETEKSSETERKDYEVLIYKTSAATIEFDKKWLKEDLDDETHLKIKEGTYVTLLVTPNKRQILTSVDIVDVKEHFTQVESLIRPTSKGSFRVIFTMPPADIMINFNFDEDMINFNFDEEAPPETEAEMQEMELETEPQSEGPPYGLTLHGLTADIITSYNGEFDDTWFLQQLGDALHIDMESSAYHNVTDVTFSKEDYAGDKDADKVYHYIYFNDDPDWKLLSTYYMKDNAYVFTLVAQEQSESETAAMGEEGTASAGGNGSAGSGSGAVTYSAPATGYSGSASESVETSFDILSVSTNLVAFCGGKEDFYQACFDYVIESGKTGVIVGTMSGYEIDPEEKKADFKISLNIGGAITGTYDKGKNKFSFSGL